MVGRSDVSNRPSSCAPPSWAHPHSCCVHVRLPRPPPRYEPSALEVVREVPLPTLAEMGGPEGYLPSQRFPSDHLPVVFDLRFRAAGAPGSSSAAGGSAAAGGSGGAAAAGGSDEGSGDAGAAAAAAGNVLAAAMYNAGRAAEALGREEVVAVPTDTLYGLAACANSSAAVAHIYATKQRGDHKPLAICVADLPDVGRYGDTRVGAAPAGLGACWGSAQGTRAQTRLGLLRAAPAPLFVARLQASQCWWRGCPRASVTRPVLPRAIPTQHPPGALLWLPTSELSPAPALARCPPRSTCPRACWRTCSPAPSPCCCAAFPTRRWLRSSTRGWTPSASASPTRPSSAPCAGSTAPRWR